MDCLYNASVTYGFTKSHILFIKELGKDLIDLMPFFIFNLLFLWFRSCLFQTEVDCDVVAKLTAKIRAWDLVQNSLWSRRNLPLIQQDLDQALLNLVSHTPVLHPCNAFGFSGTHPDLQEKEEKNISFCIYFFKHFLLHCFKWFWFIDQHTPKNSPWKQQGFRGLFAQL